jgi:hypothetical protein
MRPNRDASQARLEAPKAGIPTHVDPKTVAKGLAVNRLLIGAGMTAVPGLATRMWIGAHADNDGARLMARAAGARDAGLALGTLASLGHKRQRGRWLEAAALADGVDLLATLAARRSLPPKAVAVGTALAGASAGMHLWLRRRLG